MSKMLLRNLHVSFASVVAALVVLGGAATSALAAPVKNIVLVHGAWVDGSGWKPVYEVAKLGLKADRQCEVWSGSSWNPNQPASPIQD